MPEKRLSMRKSREVLRLAAMGLAQSQIASACSIVQSTVHKYLKQAKAANLSWPLPEDLSDRQLDALLFGGPAADPPSRRVHAAPDFAAVHKQLQTEKNVTLQLLWDEYKNDHPAGYKYSRFCELYREWSQARNLALRQQHKPGEKVFVDYAGATIPIHDPTTGEVHSAAIFVAACGLSSYTFAEATRSQDLGCWIGSHIRAFEFFQGVPAIVVPDNVKTGISKAHRYEPDLNPTYSEMATHYGVAVIPARPRKPKDKAKVENAVQVVQRWILAALRKRKFFSLEEANQAIAGLLAKLNDRPFRKREGTRRSWFEAVDRPAHSPLPCERYQTGTWRRLKVDLDYHVPAEGHFYSVPYQLVGQQVDLRITATTIEIFQHSLRVASHVRSLMPDQATTLSEHRPKAHQHYVEWTPSRLLGWSETNGPNTAQLFATIIETKPHPEMGYRCCLGIMRLAGKFTPARLEAAARRAVHFGTYTLQSVESILKSHLEDQPLDVPVPGQPAVIHGNIRGAAYFDLSLDHLSLEKGQPHA